MGRRRCASFQFRHSGVAKLVALLAGAMSKLNCDFFHLRKAFHHLRKVADEDGRQAIFTQDLASVPGREKRLPEFVTYFQRRFLDDARGAACPALSPQKGGGQPAQPSGIGGSGTHSQPVAACR